MHIRPNTVVIDDEHVPAATAAGSAEPMRRADHKSKAHGKPRPARKSETLGGGHFVFRRHEDGRIHPRQDPFEHGSVEDAVIEMQRLVGLTGETFEVYSRAVVGWRECGQSNGDVEFCSERDAATAWPEPDYVDMERGEYTDAEIVNGYYGPEGGAA